MARLDVRPVHTERDRARFLTFPWRIYRGDPLWVPPLLPDRRRFLDPRRGPFFKHGEAELYLALRDGQVAGTICVAVDHEMNRLRAARECIFGFFECRDDPEAAHALLDRAEAYGRDHGMDILAGPFNLDYEDSYGVLVEGRDRPPPLLCAHTPPYYVRLLEAEGYTPLRADNLAFALDLDPESRAFRSVRRLADRVRRSRGFTIRTPDLRSWRVEVDPLMVLLNRALEGLGPLRPWDRPALEHMFAAFVRIADPDLILFAHDGQRLVGWFPGLPNLNEAIIHADGLRTPWSYLTLALRMRKHPECLAIKSVVVLPEYWGSGVTALLIDEMARRAHDKGYRWVDLSMTSEDNPETPRLARKMGARIYKRYRVYKKALG